ncbi:hypothetical protein [Streptomyces brasiliscabiei]|uniref:hypothetical protein n=1 Tax=Streptomyces brasiliscabiei TaxID=2736302 RepID=UPI001F34C3DF|nr:hypothetical protein [Streptomyces brasiliscabiei]
MIVGSAVRFTLPSATSPAARWSGQYGCCVDCPPRLRAELLGGVARLGVVVGATHFDAYAQDDARVAFKVASECAEEAGDWWLRAKTFSKGSGRHLYGSLRQEAHGSVPS